MISQDKFLETELSMGIGFHNPLFVDLANQTAKQLTIDYQSVLDYGAGTGVYSKAFIDLGKKVSIYEIWDAHVQYIKSNITKAKIVKKPLTTDLMLFIEVAEHMTDHEIDSLFNSISPNYILFSSTSETTSNDEKWGHINVKQQHEWIDLFKHYGYELQTTLSYPTSWSKLFKKI